MTLDYKVYKDLCKLKYLDYLYWLKMCYFYQLVNNDKYWIIACLTPKQQHKKGQNFKMMIKPQSTIESGKLWWAMSDYKNYKDFRKPRYIDCYLHWIVVYYSCQLGSDCNWYSSNANLITKPINKSFQRVSQSMMTRINF